MLLQYCLEIQRGRGKCRPEIKIKINPRNGKVWQNLFLGFTPSPPSPFGDKFTVWPQSVYPELPKNLNQKGENCKPGKDTRANEGLWQPAPHGELRLLDWRHGATVDRMGCDA